MGVDKNWFSDFADNSVKVVAKSLESSNTVLSSICRGLRNSSINGGTWCGGAMLSISYTVHEQAETGRLGEWLSRRVSFMRLADQEMLG